ncbi:MAG: hypothetical protein ABIV11_11130 [Gemmatimonadaceae bacterium]
MQRAHSAGSQQRQQSPGYRLAAGDRDVLQHDVRVDEIELPADSRERVVSLHELRVRDSRALHVTAGFRQHCVGHVHAHDFPTPPSHWNYQAANSAPEIERACRPEIRRDTFLDGREHVRYVLLTTSEELSDILG